jgi:hypothetical protein
VTEDLPQPVGHGLRQVRAQQAGRLGGVAEPGAEQVVMRLRHFVGHELRRGRA